MIQTEFVRSLNSNYERLLLEKKPEEKKFQYCMLNRGGIKGLLPCSIRYINGLAYLYYDITSRQNVAQIYEKRPINRKWIKDFVWSARRMQLELSRFLLDEKNVLWHPQQIFQDLDNDTFFFLYVPYYEGETGFQNLLEFWVEHIDYEDEGLVECVYKMYEQYEKKGAGYIYELLHEDIGGLEEMEKPTAIKKETAEQEREKIVEEQEEKAEIKNAELKSRGLNRTEEEKRAEEPKKAGRGLRAILEGRKRKEREEKENYRELMQTAMLGSAVAEEAFEEDFGKTVYIEEVNVTKNQKRRLYNQEGIVVARLDGESMIIGKKPGEADMILEDISVSRVHARITRAEEKYFLEDLNSTNGTFLNGIRLQPYEKRRLEEEDEIRLGKKNFIFR